MLGTVTAIDDESEEIAVRPDGVPEEMRFERATLLLMTRAESRDPPEISHFVGDRVLDEKRPGAVTGKVVEASQRAGKYRVRFGPDSGIVEREQQELSLVARRDSEA